MPNITKLDKVFSEYIRRRDADEYGRVKCCTCDAVAHWSEVDCGHWMHRSNMGTRFDEENCHAQCRVCNRHFDGEFNKHRAYIIERHGFDASCDLGHKRIKEVHLMQYEIDQMTQDYKDKIKALES